MLIHNYDATSGEYLGASPARIDPLETARTGQAAYLVPAHASTQAPPEPVEGFARCFAHGAWAQVRDHRGETYYSTATGRAVTIEELGELPDGLAEDAPGAHQAWDDDSATWVDDQATSNAARVAEIDAELAALDLAAVRPLRAVLAARQASETPDAGDVSTLAGLEAQAVALRAERAGLTAGA